MSAAAIARRRRSEQPSGQSFQPQQPPPPTPSASRPPQGPPGVAAGGLTLPQVIELVDKRLIALETTTKETPSNLTTVLNEFDQRHDMLLNEIVGLRKEIEALKKSIIETQAFSMSLNQKLVDKLLSTS
jgi:hypothetical protein